MRSYNKARATIWSGETGRLLKQHPESTRLLAIYLFTNERAMAEPWGLYYCQRATMMDALRATPAKVDDGLATLADLAYAYYDARTEWVWVVNMAREQVLTDGRPLAPRDNMSAAANRWYSRCPRNPFLGPFFDRYVALLHLNERRDGGEVEAPPVPGQVVTVAPAIQPNLLGPAPVAAMTSPADIRGAEFDVFWAAYHPRGKDSKPKARAAWMKLKPRAEDVMAGLARWHASQRWAEKFVVGAAKFLLEERWLEYPEPAPMAGTSQRTQDVVEALHTPGQSIFDLEAMLPAHVREAPKKIRSG